MSGRAWLILVAAGCLTLRATAAGKFALRRWTVEDGLPQQSVQCLLQTRDGYLWCGTWFGLARFDGAQFTVFDRRNTPAFAEDETVTALAEDADGRLWIGTKRGLVVRQGRAFVRGAAFRKTDGNFRKLPQIQNDHGLASANPSVAPLNPRENPSFRESPDEVRVSALAPATGGGVWAGTSEGLFRCFPGTNRPVGLLPEAAPSPDSSHLHALAELPSGRLLVLTHRLHEFDPASGRARPVGPEINASRPANLSLRGDTAWLAHYDGLDRVAGSTAERLFTNSAGAPGRLEKVLARRDGSVWFGTVAGELFSRDGGTVKPVETGLAAGTGISSLMEDAAGNVWLGTSAGLVRLRPAVLRTLTTRDGLPSDHVWSVCPAAGGGVWAGTDRGAAWVEEAQAGRPVPESPGIVRAVLEDRHSRLWVAWEYRGLQLFRGGRRQPFPPDAFDRFPTPRALFADARGEIWVGSGEGVGRWGTNAWAEWWSPTNGLPRGAVRVIHQDRNGAMWFGVNGAGLVRHSSQGFELFGLRHGFRDLRPTVIHETADGVLWVGTEGGLHRFAAGTAFAFTPEHGLAENLVNCILEDGTANFWLSGLKGIHRVPRAELEAVARGELARVRGDSFGGADGLENPETNGENQPAGCRTPDGRLWFPTAGGLVVLDPRAAARDNSSAPPLIERVTVDGETLVGEGVPALPARVRLAPRRAQVVRIAYTAPTTGDAARLRFRHRLRGLDDRWLEVGKERVAYFTNLRPGDYAFEVSAAGSHGDWQEPSASFAFSLAPAFVQTVWFPVSGGAALILFGAGLAALRLRWQKRALQAEHTAALAEERTRIGDDLHDELGGSLTEIGALSELAERHAAQPERVSAQVRRIRDAAAELAEAVDEIVWSLNPRHDRTEQFAAYLTSFSERFLEAGGLACHWDLPAPLPSLPMRAEVRHELFLLVKEALHNTVKHAHATGVCLQMRVEAGALSLVIRDDGVGFDPGARGEAGNGLASMRRRAAKLGGTVLIRSTPGNGTQIGVQVPLPPPEQPSLP